LDQFKWFIRNPEFHAGLKVVPILMLANVFLGIYYNQSVWYKLTDRTRAGSVISLIGAGITLVLLFVLIPRMGYMGAAWTTLICYASMAAISYGWGQRHYPIPYHVGRVLSYMAGAVFLWWACDASAALGVTGPVGDVFNYGLRVLILAGFVGIVWRNERRSFSPSHE
ncbi:MAG: polysaccharide biosynthesis C-terminal domain-containing protein, partial [Flavobacteriales bacterium]|nr:polysaccharide biosynthesis C-terminal domain-containing protein [Flavobacteriales bacterium]